MRIVVPLVGISNRVSPNLYCELCSVAEIIEACANGGGVEAAAFNTAAFVERATTTLYAESRIGIAAGMVVISSAVATASSKVTYSLISLALAASSDPISAITFEAAAGTTTAGAMMLLEEGGRAGGCSGIVSRGGGRSVRHLNRAFASLGIGRTSRRASFIATPFARRRHYAIRRKRRSTAGRR